MNKKSSLFIIVLVFYLFVIFIMPRTTLAFGQEGFKGELRIPDPDLVQILYLKDGSQLIGSITVIRENEIDFKTDLGVLTVPIANIKRIKEVLASAIKEGEHWFPNPNSTRLYFAPTGRMLRKGEGYFCGLLPFLSRSCLWSY